MFKRTRRLSKNFEEYCAEEDSPYPLQNEMDLTGGNEINGISSQSTDWSLSNENNYVPLSSNASSQEMILDDSGKLQSNTSANGDSNKSSSRGGSNKRPAYSRQDTPLTPMELICCSPSTVLNHHEVGVPQFLENATRSFREGREFFEGCSFHKAQTKYCDAIMYLASGDTDYHRAMERDPTYSHFFRGSIDDVASYAARKCEICPIDSRSEYFDPRCGQNSTNSSSLTDLVRIPHSFLRENLQSDVRHRLLMMEPPGDTPPPSPPIASPSPLSIMLSGKSGPPSFSQWQQAMGSSGSGCEIIPQNTTSNGSSGKLSKLRMPTTLTPSNSGEVSLIAPYRTSTACNYTPFVHHSSMGSSAINPWTNSSDQVPTAAPSPYGGIPMCSSLDLQRESGSGQGPPSPNVNHNGQKDFHRVNLQCIIYALLADILTCLASCLEVDGEYSDARKIFDVSYRLRNVLHGGETIKYDVSMRNLTRFFSCETLEKVFADSLSLGRSTTKPKALLMPVNDTTDVTHCELGNPACQPEANNGPTFEDEMEYCDIEAEGGDVSDYGGLGFSNEEENETQPLPEDTGERFKLVSSDGSGGKFNRFTMMKPVSSSGLDHC